MGTRGALLEPASEPATAAMSAAPTTPASIAPVDNGEMGMDVSMPRPEAEQRPYPDDFTPDELCFVEELESLMPRPLGFAALFAADIDAPAPTYSPADPAADAAQVQRTTDAVFERLGLAVATRR